MIRPLRLRPFGLWSLGLLVLWSALRAQPSPTPATVPLSVTKATGVFAGPVSASTITTANALPRVAASQAAISALSGIVSGEVVLARDINAFFRYDSAASDTVNGYSVLAATGMASVGRWIIQDPFRYNYGDGDPYSLLFFGAGVGSLVGGRLNNGLLQVNSGELPIGTWDPTLVSQYSLIWGWSQISYGVPVNYGASSKGSAQIGYQGANAGPYSANFGFTNTSLGAASLVAGANNIAGAAAGTTAPVPLTYHDNWATSPDHARLKVAGDYSAVFTAGSYVFLWGNPAAADGTLSTRTSDTAGTLTLTTGGASTYAPSDTITVKWAGGASGRTLVLSAATYTAGTKTWVLVGSGGSGDVLPAQGTRVWLAGTVDTARTARAVVSSSAHAGGVTTIELATQLPATLDLTRTGLNAPWVMSLASAGSTSHGYNAVVGHQNRALGYAGFISGEGNRISYPAESAAAHGSGHVLSGNYAFASGYTNIVSGVSAVGLGGNQTVSGNQSIAAGGTFSNVSGERAGTLGGTYLTVAGTDAVAMGSNQTASGTRSAALGGYGHNASGVNAAIVGGINNVASANNTFATGSGNTASAERASVLGGRALVVSASDSAAIGSNLTVSGVESFSTGSDSTNAGTDSVSFGAAMSLAAGGNYSLLAGQAHTLGAATHAAILGGNNTVSAGANYSSALGRLITVADSYVHASGREAVSRRYGEWLHSGGSLTGTGKQQAGLVLYAGTTTNNSATDLYIDYAESVPSQRYDMTTSSVSFLDLHVVALTGSGAAGVAVQQVGFTAQGVLSRSSSGGGYSWSGPATATALAVGVAVTSITGDGATVTATTPTECFLDTGDSVVISGSSVGGYNGTWSVTRVSATSFTWSSAQTGTGTGATARAVRPWSVALGVVAGSGLRVQATGETGKTITWLARVNFTELVQ